MWLRHKKSTHWPKAVITNVVSHITSKNSIIFFHLFNFRKFTNMLCFRFLLRFLLRFRGA